MSDEAIQILAKLDVGRPVKAEKRLASPHPLVAKTQGILSKSGTDQYGVLTRSLSKRILDVQASPVMLSRALRVGDAIVKFFDWEAVSIFVEDSNGDRKTLVKIFDESVVLL